MALIKCPDCGTDVSDAAAACPKCARPIAGQTIIGPYRAPPAAKPKNVSGGIALVVFVCLGLWIYSMAKNSDTEVQQTTAVAPTSPSGAEQQPTPEARQSAADSVLVMTPEDLFEKYKANEVATDNALAGKIVQITAPVKSIDKDFTDSAVLMFATGEEFSDMGASLKDSEKSKAALLSRGQTVTVQCGTMRRIMESPRGGECVLIDNAPVSQPAASQADAAKPSLPAAPADLSANANAQTADQQAVQPPDATAATSDPELLKVISNTSGPSFDCSTATNVTARAICGNDQLRLLDRQMAILYYSKSNYANNPAARTAQRDWLHNRNETCVADVLCLTDQFNQRIQQLNQLPAPTAADVTAQPVNQDLARRYAEAISSSVTSRWLRPDSLAAEPCDVDIVQSPGGDVVSANAAPSCPYDDDGKRSVENAVLRSSPLPYAGYESVFARHLTFTFRPSM